MELLKKTNLEYPLPGKSGKNKRADVILTQKSGKQLTLAIIELKQWTADFDPKSNPSLQALEYVELYLKQNKKELANCRIKSRAMVYLHNMVEPSVELKHWHQEADSYKKTKIQSGKKLINYLPYNQLFLTTNTKLHCHAFVYNVYKMFGTEEKNKKLWQNQKRIQQTKLLLK